ncbi:hypothetical protein L3Q82_025685 [Scortum barcoo]|uniref:Uncharacterized protein n=1 Tax=Scortum barcoo TaxID=214431 RepID=A0ACB8WN10_9TELE|nr:hypothetical protein L3Q82_025685 [Scortum barcoo]
MSDRQMLVKHSKPSFSQSQVDELVKRLFGLTPLKVQPLPSYDDQNFYVAVSGGGEYVLKIMNVEDSKNPDLIELQNVAMSFLHQNGLPAQTALPTTSGQLMSLEEIDCGYGCQKYVVRLLSYLPGTTISKAPLTPELLYEVGRIAARMDTILQKVSEGGVKEVDDGIIHPDVRLVGELQRVHEGAHQRAQMDKDQSLQRLHQMRHQSYGPVAVELLGVRCLWHWDDAGRLPELWHSPQLQAQAQMEHPNLSLLQRDKFIWSLSNVPMLEAYISVLDGDPLQEVVKSVMDQYKTSVVPKYSSFRKCLNHGDFNDLNVLVQPDESEGYRVSGILDFGDMNFGYYIHELAIAIMYMMMEHPEPVKVGGPVLAGWESVLPLNEAERDCLFVLVLSRFCQSLTLARHSVILHPENTEYLMISSKKGIHIFRQLWELGKKQVEKIWFQCAAQFSDRKGLRPASGNRPRPVIIMAALRERRQLTHEGQKLYIQQDFSAAVKEKRRSFNKVCERLIGLNIRFFMRFPAVLTFTYNGEKHAFQAFMDGLP